MIAGVVVVGGRWLAVGCCLLVVLCVVFLLFVVYCVVFCRMVAACC